jgi:hypothetical protein
MENIVRKKWLIGFCLINMVTVLSLIWSANIIISLVIVLISIGFGGITYFNGYKKRGTSWLSLIVTVRAMSILYTIGLVIYLYFTKAFMTYLSFVSSTIKTSPQTLIAVFLISFSISIYYTICSYKLRKINKLSKSKLS